MRATGRQSGEAAGEGTGTERRRIRTVIVDDSTFVVERLGEFFRGQDGFEVVGVAETGVEGVERVAELRRAMTSPERGAGLGRPKTLYRNSVGTLESHPGKAGHPRKRVLRSRPRGRHEA